MLILGIDPGTNITGYGLIKVESSSLQAIDYGCIKPSTTLKLTDRYLFIYNAIEELIEKYAPEVLVVETQFFKNNHQSVFKLVMARGIIIVAAKKKGLAVFEYAPRKAKLAVTGKGSSSKFEVQRMVQLLLNLKEIPTPEDAADALSLAICHANSLRYQTLNLVEM